MTDQTNDTAAQLAALLAQMQTSGATATAAPSAWSKPAAPTAPAEILGVSVPISLDTPVGKIRVYLNFPGTAAASPTALLGLIEQLAAAGLPLDAWQPKESGSGGWGNRDGNGSGWNSNRGGYGNRSNGWRR
jgi:hypothetical protein